VLKGFSPAYVSIPEENRVVFYSDGNLVCTDWDGRVVWVRKNLPREIASSFREEFFEIYSKINNDYYEYIINLKSGDSFVFPSSLIPVNEGCVLNLIKINNNTVIIQRISNYGAVLNQAILPINEKKNILLQLSTNDFNLR